jgi:hypothetical protein
MKKGRFQIFGSLDGVMIQKLLQQRCVRSTCKIQQGCTLWQIEQGSKSSTKGHASSSG